STAVCMPELRRSSEGDADGEELGGEDHGSGSGPAEPMDESRPDEKSVYERIAELAGEYDYDMYWERSYEHNLSEGSYRKSISAFSMHMRELSEEKERREDTVEYAYNAVRESYMRRQIVEAIAAGHNPERIVV
ncbi:hypothetical protein GNF82_20915, partial [Clostridium perfringens]